VSDPRRARAARWFARLPGQSGFRKDFVESQRRGQLVDDHSVVRLR
jgi:hypothetical protein